MNKRYLIEYWRAVFLSLGTFASVIVVGVSLFSIIRSRTHLEGTVDRERINQAELAYEAVQKRLDDDQTAFERDIVAQIKNLQKNQTASGSGMSLGDRAALAQVVEGQKQLSARLSALEAALMNEPSKALAVPLLKKDVDDVLDREQKDAAAVRAQDDRLDRLMSNIITTTLGVLAFCLSGIGLAVTLRKMSASKTTP